MITQQGFPTTSLPFVDTKTGMVQQPWIQVLLSLWNRTGGATGNAGSPFATLAVSASPFIYRASNKGNVWISEGTYCNVSLTRGANTLDFGLVTRGIFPVSEGDILTVTYDTLTPTIYFF